MNTVKKTYFAPSITAEKIDIAFCAAEDSDPRIEKSPSRDERPLAPHQQRFEDDYRYQ